MFVLLYLPRGSFLSKETHSTVRMQKDFHRHKVESQFSVDLSGMLVLLSSPETLVQVIQKYKKFLTRFERYATYSFP